MSTVWNWTSIVKHSDLLGEKNIFFKAIIFQESGSRNESLGNTFSFQRFIKLLHIKGLCKVLCKILYDRLDCSVMYSPPALSHACYTVPTVYISTGLFFPCCCDKLFLTQNSRKKFALAHSSRWQSISRKWHEADGHIAAVVQEHRIDEFLLFIQSRAWPLKWCCPHTECVFPIQLNGAQANPPLRLPSHTVAYFAK